MRSVFRGGGGLALRRALTSCAGTACLLLPAAPAAVAVVAPAPVPAVPLSAAALPPGPDATTVATTATAPAAPTATTATPTTPATHPTATPKAAAPAEGSPQVTHAPSAARPQAPPDATSPRTPAAPTAPRADLGVSAALRRSPAPGPAKAREEAKEEAGEERGEDGRLHTAAAAAGTFDYAVTVTNHGPSGARRVIVTDRLPAALEFASSRDGCTAAGRTVTCGPLAALPVGRSHTWLITVRLAAGYGGDGSDIVNEAVVGAETSDPDPANNKASVTGLQIPPDALKADLTLAKTALLPHGRTTVRPGEKFTYRINVRNHGPATARGVRVTDRLPSLLAFVSSPDGCAPPKDADGGKAGTRLITCPVRDRLTAGESAEYRITVRVTPRERTGTPKRCTRIDNIARVTSATADPDLSDNTNRPGTNAPGGKPLCLTSGKDDGDGHHGDDGDHGDGHGKDDHGKGDDHRGDGGHHGRGDLADSGAAVPGWLLWAAGGLVAAGAGLRTLSVRARRAGVKE